MRIFIFLLLIVHGLIHLMGFAKAFQLSEIKQLTLPIPKTMGVLWLIATILLLSAAILMLFKHNYWWVVGFLAISISQFLIFYFWKDAKFGTIVNAIVLIFLIIGYATWNFHHQYKSDVKRELKQLLYFQNSILNESDMVHLPEPVKKYLRYTHSVGKPKVNNFKVTFAGKIRKDEESQWMPFTSEQYNYLNKPTRLFFMKAIMNRLPVAGYHHYDDGKAVMDIRLFSLLKVQYQEGTEMNIAETVTFFNDMCCMAPPTLIDKRIIWLETEENKVKASFTNNNITITAWLYFNSIGELINFKSNDRYAADAGKKLPWATPLNDYKDINGYRLATKAETIYTYPDRELCYGTFSLLNAEYNLNQ